MSVLYLTEQGAFVQKDGGRLVVRKRGQTLDAVRLLPLRQVVVFGNVQLSAGTVTCLLERGIDAVFLSLNGRFRGRLAAFEGKNIELRRAQFQRSLEDGFLLDLAKRFVDGKIRNCQTLLRRQNRQVASSLVAGALARMRWAAGALPRAETLDQVRGLEGAAAAAYFGVFGEIIRQEGFPPFRTRTRRPPRDALNALLSFGYTLLLGHVAAAVEVAGLDPFAGCLHADRNGKPSLVLDLMEEFRPLLVDGVAVAAINRRQILPDDFRYQPEFANAVEVDPDDDEPVAGYPVRLKPESIRKWVGLYEANLARQVTYPRTGVTLTYRQVCLEQARLLARHVHGTEPYEAFVVR